MESVKKAVIDVGSSSIKYAVYDLRTAKPVLIKEGDPITTSLGRGLMPGGSLSPEAWRHSLDAVETFVTEIKALGAEVDLVVATEALRKTSDQACFLADLQTLIGGHADIRCISAEEEARWGLRSAETMLKLNDQPRLFIDPGGSSNDFAFTSPITTGFHTIPFGMNDLLKIVAVSEEAGRLAEDDCRRLGDFMQIQYGTDLKSFLGSERPSEVVGTSGAAIALAAVQAGLRQPDRQSRLLAAHDRRLGRQEIAEMIKKMSPLSPAERRQQWPCLGPKRSIIFVHGAMIYLTLLDSLGLSEVRVNGFGMKLGGLLEPR